MMSLVMVYMCKKYELGTYFWIICEVVPSLSFSHAESCLRRRYVCGGESGCGRSGCGQ